MSKPRSLQFDRLESDPNESSAITIFDDGDNVHIWFESEDGECSKTFTRSEFEAFVRTVQVFKGWTT